MKFQITLKQIEESLSSIIALKNLENGLEDLKSATKTEALEFALSLQNLAKDEIKNGDLQIAKVLLQSSLLVFKLIPDLSDLGFRQQEVA